MTILEKIQSDLEVIYLGKKIRVGIPNHPNNPERIFEVKSIEVGEGIDGLEILFLDRVRDWPAPQFKERPGQNTVTPLGDWIDHAPKDLQTEFCSGSSEMPEIIV